jgi:hypothetical protein
MEPKSKNFKGLLKIKETVLKMQYQAPFLQTKGSRLKSLSSYSKLESLQFYSIFKCLEVNIRGFVGAIQ